MFSLKVSSVWVAAIAVAAAAVAVEVVTVVMTPELQGLFVVAERMADAPEIVRGLGQRAQSRADSAASERTQGTASHGSPMDRRSRFFSATAGRSVPELVLA